MIEPIATTVATLDPEIAANIVRTLAEEKESNPKEHDPPAVLPGGPDAPHPADPAEEIEF